MFKKLTLITAILFFAVAITFTQAPRHALAQGGGGGSTGGTKNFAGNWSGTITTSFGTGLFTMSISQSGATLSGSTHFGAPIFDSTLKLSASSPDGTHFSGYALKTKGSLPITGILSAGGSTITGTVTQGEVYTFVVTRN